MAAPASAKIKVVTHRQGPMKLEPYEVRYTSKETRAVKAPGMNGFLIGMYARVVDKKGRPIPIKQVMLHHIVYKNRGRFLGDRRDPVCGGRAESFYGNGEEHLPLRFPPHYGYKIHKRDKWQTGWMLMNHKNHVQHAYIEYRAIIDTAKGLAPVTPYWLRVTGCNGAVDPIFTVPGGGPPGSRYTISHTFRMPRPGLIIAAGGHAHGGAFDVALKQPACGDRSVFVSQPTYGLPSHPYYHVLPVLHEPGPINMSWVQSGLGVPVGGGESLRVVSDYDNQWPHVRAMGIMHLYVHHTPNAQPGCAPLPGDIQNIGTKTPGRYSPPKVTVPLTGLDSNGRSQTIDHPPGPLRRFNGDVRVKVHDFSFSLRRISIPLGAAVRWRFPDSKKHNVSLANGPFGFASRNQRRGGTYTQRFTKPGVYRNFCSLHPVDMTESIVVRGSPK
jgi:plastocyanin